LESKPFQCFLFDIAVGFRENQWGTWIFKIIESSICTFGEKKKTQNLKKKRKKKEKEHT